MGAIITDLVNFELIFHLREQEYVKKRFTNPMKEWVDFNYCLLCPFIYLYKDHVNITY